MSENQPRRSFGMIDAFLAIDKNKQEAEQARIDAAEIASKAGVELRARAEKAEAERDAARALVKQLREALEWSEEGFRLAQLVHQQEERQRERKGEELCGPDEALDAYHAKVAAALAAVKEAGL